MRTQTNPINTLCIHSNKLTVQSDKIGYKTMMKFFANYDNLQQKRICSIFISVNIFYQNNLLHIQKE